MECVLMWICKVFILACPHHVYSGVRFLAAFYWRRDWNHLPSQVRKNDMFGMEATNSPF